MVQIKCKKHVCAQKSDCRQCADRLSDQLCWSLPPRASGGYVQPCKALKPLLWMSRSNGQVWWTCAVMDRPSVVATGATPEAAYVTWSKLLAELEQGYLKRLFRSFWPRYIGSHFKWYRKWYGGRWELHYIDVCHAYLWLEMAADKKWPEYRPPCSFGTPLIEDY